MVATLARLSPDVPRRRRAAPRGAPLRAGWLVPATVAAAAALVIWVPCRSSAPRPRPRTQRASIAARHCSEPGHSAPLRDASCGEAVAPDGWTPQAPERPTLQTSAAATTPAPWPTRVGSARNSGPAVQRPPPSRAAQRRRRGREPPAVDARPAQDHGHRRNASALRRGARDVPSGGAAIPAHRVIESHRPARGPLRRRRTAHRRRRRRRPLATCRGAIEFAPAPRQLRRGLAAGRRRGARRGIGAGRHRLLARGPRRHRPRDHRRRALHARRRRLPPSISSPSPPPTRAPRPSPQPTDAASGRPTRARPGPPSRSRRRV